MHSITIIINNIMESTRVAVSSWKPSLIAGPINNGLKHQRPGMSVLR